MKFVSLTQTYRLTPLLAVLVFVLGSVVIVTTQEAQTDLDSKTKQPDVVYVPTPMSVVEKMLELAEVKKGDVVYDLGCGDGRIVVAAAKKYGVKAVGIDIDPQRVLEARENVRTNKLEHLVTIKQDDIFNVDFGEATVVTLYLLPELNVRLMPQLAKLKPGSRIVSHDFDMRGAKPVQVYEMETASDEPGVSYGRKHKIYKWVVPWEPEHTTNLTSASALTQP